jgi:single-stranded-DNA-specific exonuclease
MPEPDEALTSSLAQALQLPHALAGLLVQRGFRSPEAARAFLRPTLDALQDPYTLRDMDRAVATIVGAVRAGRRIMVHGDYDVDGQCATALLTRALRVAKADVVSFVPHRLRDGYDFGEAGITEAKNERVGLIITCDCGINAVEAVREARKNAMQVVVTDHHLPGERLPDAEAVVDPQRSDDESELKQLCGTGIAFKLVQALIPALGLPAQLHLHLLDLVALATVADVVPLTGENRILVKQGLKVMAKSRWPGIQALLAASRLGGGTLRAGHLGYVLGPRLNAAGRIGDAMDGLRLLLTDDAAEARALATRLSALNDERQTIDQRILEEALAQVERDMDPERDAALVLRGDDWHAGVVGIVASRVVERYGRPTFLVAFNDDIGKGSGRSISAFDLHAALVECGDLLERFGGHRMAAGLTMRRDSFEAFRERFAGVARQRLGPDDLGPEQRIDLVIGLAEANAELERLCQHLEPCGMGNPGPVFGVRGVQLSSPRRVGSGHLKATLVEGASRLPAIGFGMFEQLDPLGSGPVDAAFRLERNEWNGSTALQARLLALTPAGHA